MAKRSQCFLILGAPRSGTTLLSRMLDSHPDIAVAPETGLLRAVYRNSWRGRYLRPYHYRQFLVYLHGWSKNFSDPAAELIEKLIIDDSSYNSSVRVSLAALVQEYGALRNTKWVGDKTPLNLRFYPQFAKLLEGVPLVILLRHPYDVICSLALLSLPKKGKLTAHHLLKAAIFVKAGLKALRKLSVDTPQLHLRYEDLVQHPEQELQRITDFLKLDFNPVMLHFQTTDHLRDREKMKSLHPHLSQSLQTQRRQRYQRDLTVQQQVLLYHYFKSDQDILPYDLEPPTVSLSWRNDWQLRKHLIYFYMGGAFWQEHWVRLKSLVKGYFRS